MRLDPYSPSSERLYECQSCGERDRCETHACRCRACGGQMKNLSVPRE
ncbi:rubrerythrin-like domain-containing protein [Salinibaculum rarum]|nr:rubrerythrin-like domain-containing protein [Salinibaculum sp. KK48]